MTVRHLGIDDYADWFSSPYLDEDIGAPDGTRLVIVHGDHAEAERSLPRLGSRPVVVCWAGSGLGAEGPDQVDLVAADDDLGDLESAVSEAPRAAAALAVLLRGQPRLDVEAGLAAESAVYSVLQAGPEFAAWRRSHPGEPVAAESDIVRVHRDGDDLTITLDRPHRHNAITSVLRDELAEALAVGTLDETIGSVHLRGSGPSFCSGGDLDEFGHRPDPATAHLTRLARSPARLIADLGNVTAHVHGSTYGGGVEMAAFSARVVADPATRFALPEVGLGLIPGAGGTVSLTRRIGRQRTAALGLTCRPIDARTALDWGLIDAIEARNGAAATGTG